ncbi:hypothetical protein BU23DRAFT_576421 [Bimuria novae-zelandiae CBS 107.79]|uniref:SnoaL-like domain-containing protein n=1 Tax=Bimuria novae-zelandiae CBS 107.79 TaxID=1447943 RepID=A0A6A5VUD0_9PLEO|nr:hypothetical protein BU23DRAFT_576421 [Bimuria novae-zelandiae CBS 107.79]
MAPIAGLAAPANGAPSISTRGENLCSRYQSPPKLCTPDPRVTVEETAKRAQKFFKAFVIDGDAKTMFSFIDNVYIQNHPGYQSGPQVIWPLFCNGQPVGNATSKSCFDASTNMSYASYGVVDRWRWVDGCVHEHWDQNETLPSPARCYKPKFTLGRW